MTPNEFREKINSLPLPSGNNGWSRKAHYFRIEINKNPPEEFLTLPTIRGNMFVGNAPYISREWSVLPEPYRPLCKEPCFGGPEMWQEWTSGNMIRQAYHAWQWSSSQWETINKKMASLSHITEFGGGYGAMALMCYRLGFRGQYILVDLPEFLLLQEFYLSNVLPDIISFQFKQWHSGPTDLLIACFSLSETDEVLRTLFLNSIQPKHVLIGYQSQFDGINNDEFFSRVEGERHNDPFLPDHRYLVR